MSTSRYFVDPPPENAENYVYPCGICSKRVGKRMRAIQCDLCNFWNHIKCDEIDNKQCENLKTCEEDIIHYCKICRKDHAFPKLNQ